MTMLSTVCTLLGEQEGADDFAVRARLVLDEVRRVHLLRLLAVEAELAEGLALSSLTEIDDLTARVARVVGRHEFVRLD
jgi:hypothetical protein